LAGPKFFGFFIAHYIKCNFFHDAPSLFLSYKKHTRKQDSWRT